MTYDTLKTKVVFFSKSHCQKLNRQPQDAKIRLSCQKKILNEGAKRWLEIGLKSHLNFTLNIEERVKKACIAEIQMKYWLLMYRLVPRLLEQLHLFFTQSTALYVAK